MQTIKRKISILKFREPLKYNFRKCHSKILLNSKLMLKDKQMKKRMQKEARYIHG